MKKAPLNIEKPAFVRLLLKWNREQNNRQMPWKGEKDPYRIWLSEIILQQTRVDQGMAYYKRFIQTFPTIDRLAGATDAKVFKSWEGLGYYSRCRNLLTTARYISRELKGRFPDRYEDILELKGIGPYTAAAISSFAFNKPYAVVDGNVFRVLARVFGIGKAIDSTEGKKYFSSLAQELLDKQEPGLYNQALMDFGATICKPALPLCNSCVFRQKCAALISDRVNKLPVKEKKLKIKQRWFNYFLLEYRGRIAIRHRAAKDIWQGLYEFPLIETVKETKKMSLLSEAKKKGWVRGTEATISLSPAYKQQLSHQLIRGLFIRILLDQKPVPNKEWIWVARNTLKDFAFPRLINQYLLQ